VEQAVRPGQLHNHRRIKDECVTVAKVVIRIMTLHWEELRELTLNYS